METKTMVKVENAEDKKVDNNTVSAAETKPAPKAPQEKTVKEAKTAAKETKPAAKKTAKTTAKSEKTTAKETKTAKAAKTTTKKTAAKTASKATTDKKINTFLQFAGNEYNVDEVIEKVRAAAAAETGKKTFKSLDIYVKPEENVAYYVVNGKPGSVQL